MVISRLFSLLRKTIKSKKQKKTDRWFEIEGDITLLLDYPLDEKSIIFDVGGYKGQWTSEVYLFEPVKEFAEFSRKRFEKNKKIKVFEFGLSGKTREEKIVLKKSGSSTLLKGEGEKIKLKDIKEFLDENKIKKVDLISINIEGGEYELLERMIEMGLIKKFENIQIQFHEIGKNYSLRRNKIREELSKTHKQKYCFPFVWESWEIESTQD
jgi:FkbM family methyltransferase